MKIAKGQQAPTFILTDISGKEFNLEKLKGKRYLLTFYRFASCPFCNLRLHNVNKEYNNYDKNFEVVAVFDSKLKNLQRFTTRHQSPFPILADEDNRIHRMYQVEHSILGVAKGILFRFPGLMLGMFKGYIPWRIKGDLTGMPADFLVDEDGIIQTAYYGNDEGDHIPLHLVKQFAQHHGELEANFIEV